MTTTLDDVKKQIDDDISYLDSMIREQVGNLESQMMFLSGDIDDLRGMLAEILRRLTESKQEESLY